MDELFLKEHVDRCRSWPTFPLIHLSKSAFWLSRRNMKASFKVSSAPKELGEPPVNALRDGELG